MLQQAVRNNSQVLISLRNNKKLLARVKAFDRHANMVLENVKEVSLDADEGEEMVWRSWGWPSVLGVRGVVGLGICCAVDYGGGRHACGREKRRMAM